MGSGVFLRGAWVLGLILVTLLVAPPAAAQPAPPELTDTVNDFANVIDAGSRQELDRISRRLLEASGDALVVATVDTIEPWGDIQTYATEMFENHGRGIGTKDRDNGLLVLLAVKDRRVRVEVGYELEGFITDGFAGETSREVMTPYFRKGAYGQGLVAGVTTFASRIAEARGVSIDGLPQVPQRRRIEGGVPLIVWVVIAFVILNAITGGGGRGGRRGRWSSHVGPFGAGYWGWSAGRRGGGSWGGGGFGGGGFGGGFGGFGGGGSGGGGGGASW